MATPIKKHERIWFPETDLCVSCSLTNKQRYYIIRTDMNKGPAFDVISYCFQKSLSIQENVGTYVCSHCFKLLNRIKDMDIRRAELYNKVMMSSQQFKVISVKKRGSQTPRTPRVSKLSDSRSTPHHRHPDMTISTEERSIDTIEGSFTKSTNCNNTTKPASTRSLFGNEQQRNLSTQVSGSFNEQANHTSTVNKDLDLAIPLSPTPSPFKNNKLKQKKDESSGKKQKLKQTISFRSSKLCTLMHPVVKALANGSVRKALTLIFNSSDITTKESSKKNIKSIIEKECQIFSKQSMEINLQKRETEDLENFDVTKLQEDFKNHAPFLWSCATQAATSTYSNTYNQIKVCAALCVIMQGRSRFLNSLQHVVGITMYNNQLQKDGFSVLAKLGFSVSHSTLNEKLNKAKILNENMMKSYQSNLAIASKSHLERVDTEHSYAVDISPSTMNDHSYSTSCSDLQHRSAPQGYRFNIDNLDFNIKVREMTQDHQNVSRHFTQMMALVDRVNSGSLTDDQPVGDLLEIENSEFLPTAEDNYTLRKDMIQVVSNILIEHLPSFKVFKDIYPSHFKHEHSAEMAKKSIVIPLGILLKNENKTNDMIEILQHLQQYVPGVRPEVEGIHEREERNPKMQAIPVGGDQLTCERIRGAHMARLDGDTPEERLEGLITMVEDFHEKINFLQAMMDRFYKPASARETGTLYQLRNVINRRNVVKNASADYHAVGSFIDLVTTAILLSMGFSGKYLF
ncbi:LOW QUALITY PROTEIN: uncharacterized protein [Argopecten irradians]|uniref:LOW QUALITY PROTEIN: uncharacterized protein n=1 Tax=Argopecten irradians TaxID=31199 RepID=UPI00371997B1